MFKIQAISAMDTVRLRDPIDAYPTIQSVRGLKGERVSFQIRADLKPEPDASHARKKGYYTLRSPLRPYTHVCRIGHVPVELAAYLDRSNDDYISKEPGLFPDVLFPLKPKEIFQLHPYSSTTLMVTVDIPEEIEAGEYPLYFTFTEASSSMGDVKTHIKVMVQVEDLVIKKNDLIFTEWFHCDSIADYHNVKMMSAKHWKLIEAFIKTAARTGITMLLTPLFTPPLDTAIGTERPTMQLVGVKKEGDTYSFDFTLLEKWVQICHKYGIEYFEMSHLFTQWGVAYCPKIVVEIDGKQVKEFGWHVEAMSDLYKNFLSQFLPALTAKLQELGIADKTYFHISDEPSYNPEKPDYENYKAAKAFIAPYIKGYKLMDALSNIEFYKTGLIEYPVCCTDHIEPFMEEDIKERWCYYCCGQGDLVANRFIAMPAHRNRILGLQLFRMGMSGFLQWGYNFYYTAGATKKVNPFVSTDGEQSWPAGDPFSVYPYGNEAIESIRTVIFHMGLQDRALLQMLAEKIGEDATKAWIDEQAGMTVTFKEYPRNKEFLESLHDQILDRLLDK